MSYFTQICGILGSIIAIIAFFCNEHKKIVIYKSISDGIFAIQWFILGGITGGIACLIAVVRNILLILAVKKGKKTLPLIVTFIFIILFIGIINFRNPLELTATIGSVLFTIAFGIKEIEKLKFVTLFASILWLIYGIIFNSIGGILTESFSIISTVLSLVILYKNKTLIKDDIGKQL